MKNQLSFYCISANNIFTFAQSAPASASTTFAGSADAYYKYDFSGRQQSN
jgi:hypothetical protein